VRIDRTNKLPLDQLHTPNEKNVTTGRKGRASSTTASDASSLSSVTESLVAKARESAEVDSKAVAEAKRLLAEGLLDTPQAAQRAAEAILHKGL